MCQTIRGVSYSLPKGIVTNYLLFVSFSGSQNVTYSIELDKSRPQEVLRRMFFLHENKTTFRTTQQVFLPKEDEWYCDFRHTVYLRVSSLERFFPSQFFACHLKVCLDDYKGILETAFFSHKFIFGFSFISIYLTTALFIYSLGKGRNSKCE